MTGWWPDWLTYETLRQALYDLGGPYAEPIGLAVLVTLVLGLFVRWVIAPLKKG